MIFLFKTSYRVTMLLHTSTDPTIKTASRLQTTIKAATTKKVQSINQSTLFKQGKWLSKLVFRHAV